MCLCFHTLDRSLNAYLSNIIFDPLLDNSLLAIHTATMALSLWVKLRDASLDAQEDPPSHVHRITGKVALGQCWCTLAHHTGQSWCKKCVFLVFVSFSPKQNLWLLIFLNLNVNSIYRNCLCQISGVIVENLTTWVNHDDGEDAGRTLF